MDPAADRRGHLRRDLLGGGAGRRGEVRRIASNAGRSWWFRRMADGSTCRPEPGPTTSTSSRSAPGRSSTSDRGPVVGRVAYPESVDDHPPEDRPDPALSILVLGCDGSWPGPGRRRQRLSGAFGDHRHPGGRRPGYLRQFPEACRARLSGRGGHQPSPPRPLDRPLRSGHPRPVRLRPDRYPGVRSSRPGPACPTWRTRRHWTGARWPMATRSTSAT